MSKIAIGIILAYGIMLFWLASCERDLELLITGQEGVVNYENHEDSADYSWDSTQVVQITLKGNSIDVNSSRAMVDGSKVTIVTAGTYSISGSLLDGQIIVNAADEDTVRLILNGLDIHNSTGAPVYILNALKTIILLAENTDNHVQDAAVYQPSAEEPNAAIFSKTDLTIFGDGSLTVNAGGDGIKSDNQEGQGKGYIFIDKAVINITSGMDAIQAATDVWVTYAACNISAGGGSKSRIFTDISAKGIKAAGRITIDDGIYVLDAADDAIHSNTSLTINGGYIAIVAIGDGIDVNGKIEMNGGDVIIHGPTSDMNSALDYDASFMITGGFLVGAGSSRMAQAPGTGSTQYSILLNFRSKEPAGTLFHMQSRDGNEILTFTPAKDLQSIAFSSPALKKGASYDVFIGGSSTGSLMDGLYLNGTYTPGTNIASFTISLNNIKINIQ